MKKILALISNYGTTQAQYCNKLIHGLNCISKYNFDINVFSTQKNNFNNCNEIISLQYPPTEFACCIYDYLDNCNLENYDYILLTENDLLFTETNFDTFFKYDAEISNDAYTIGFLRYEVKFEKKYLIDFHYQWRVSLLKKTGIVELLEDNKMFLPENPHQGCWLLKPSTYTSLKSKISIGSSLEDKVSKIYYSANGVGSLNGIKKYIPYKDINNLLIHHQPDKYVNIFTEITDLSELQEEADCL